MAISVVSGFLVCGLGGTGWWYWGSCSLVGCLGGLLPHRTHTLGSWLSGKDSVGHAYATVHMWKSVDNFLELVFLERNGTQLTTILWQMPLPPEPSGRPKDGFHLGQQGQSRQSSQNTCFAASQREFLLFPLPFSGV